jgi:hypothetical protein
MVNKALDVTPSNIKY